MRKYIKWSEDELSKLSELYSKSTSSELIKIFDRNYTAITKKASVLGLKKDMKKSDCSVLLSEDNQTFYWMGFLLCDAHISDRRIQLKISNKDVVHLEEFCKYVNSSNKIKDFDNVVRVNMGDKKVVQKLRIKFDIKDRKTYNPPINLPNMNKEQFISFLAGIIDGDGCIYNNGNYKQISIGMHRNWLPFLEYLNKNLLIYFGNSGTLYNYDKKYNITQNNGSVSSGTSEMSYLRISKNKLIKSLWNEINCLNLYVLERKWNIINS